MSIDIYSLVCGIFFGIVVVITAYIIHGGYKEYKQIETEYFQNEKEYFRNELRILYDLHYLMQKRVSAIEKRLTELESDDNDEEAD